MTKNNIREFTSFIRQISSEIGFKVSSRGWGYILEQNGIITKNEFGKIEDLINRCRKEGLLPVDFVAEESARQFKQVHVPTDVSHEIHVAEWLEAALECERYYHPNWWDGEEYYIQMVVEKIDLITLFEPLCRDYHIPIANAKGWSSILQRAEYSRRFREAEEMGLKCVLLYCGDHDPDGLRISDTLRKNLQDVKDVYWSDGTNGYDPEDLIIERFGLDYDFIIQNNLTWIDNLITGSGKNLASHKHPNFKLDYLQNYLHTVGERKCEANALVTQPRMGRLLCQRAIESFLGLDALDRFKARKEAVKETIQELFETLGLRASIEQAVEQLRND